MIKFYLAQINTTVGDIAGNFHKIKSAYYKNRDFADIFVFPEMALTGYPCKDLIENRDLLKECKRYITKLKKLTLDQNSAIVVGAPLIKSSKLFNGALFVHNGKILKTFKKAVLPNYNVFDEKRNFQNSSNPQILKFKGRDICVCICEDLWDTSFVSKLQKAKPDLVISLNSSPYEQNKSQTRFDMAKRIGLPVVYLNQVGGQDDLVFDGGSFATNSDGNVIHLLSSFREESFILSDFSGPIVKNNFDELSEIYGALQLGLRDYVLKSGFKNVVLGLSGGIDSAFVTALAADALGPKNVLGIRLPSKYSSQHSLDDADASAKAIGITMHTIPIEDAVKTFSFLLSGIFTDSKEDITEENIQARIRGVLLMAISNKFGNLLLATGNKSEYACGYSTLYGDMCGGFAPIKDVYKSIIYKLANWRNTNIPDNSLLPKKHVIPQNSITKAPSAELRENQSDHDTLPEYEVLDKILYLMIENDLSLSSIVQMGYDRKLVTKIYEMLNRSEYKRSQAPIGTKISIRDLKLGRRYPIQNKFV